MTISPTHLTPDTQEPVTREPVTSGPATSERTVRTRRRGDRGSVSVSLTLLVVVVLAGGGLIFDGATYLAAGRHASNVGEGAARAAVATGSPDEGLSEAEARAAAIGHAVSLGVPASDTSVSFPSRTTVVVTITVRRQTSLIQLFGSSTIAVTSTGQAELTFR